MTKKGFISTAIIYSFFTFILLSLSIYLVNIKETNVLKQEEVKKIKEDLNNLGTLKGLARLILSHNGGKKEVSVKNIPDFTLIADTNEGLFQTQDDYGTSYYFRGTVDNNWVKFGKIGNNDIWWRVVRIHGNGSVKLIYNGIVSPTENEKIKSARVNTHIGNSFFNTHKETEPLIPGGIVPDFASAPEQIGYMYEFGEHRGYEIHSDIKEYLDAWYEDNLISYNDYLHDFIICNDRNFLIADIVPISGADSFVSSDAYLRLINGQPSLVCDNKDDAFTVNDTERGNGLLDYPIGLLTADELVVAGATTNKNNNEFYLYSGGYFWTMTPPSTQNMLFYLNKVIGTDESGKNDVRPVITLKPNIEAEGNGKWNDPYIVIE